MTEGDESKLIKALQTPAAVVTYRAVVGVLGTITIALVAFLGGSIMSGIDKLQASMVQVQLSIARASGRIDGQDTRLNRVEITIDGLAKEQGSLDHRVTVIEAQRGPQ